MDKLRRILTEESIMLVQISEVKFLRMIQTKFWNLEQTSYGEILDLEELQNKLVVVMEVEKERHAVEGTKVHMPEPVVK